MDAGAALDFTGEVVDVFVADVAFCVSADFTEFTTGVAANALPAPPSTVIAVTKAATFFVHFFMIGHLILKFEPSAFSCSARLSSLLQSLFF
nr:hypothetical protein [Paenibacillus xylanexedens]